MSSKAPWRQWIVSLGGAGLIPAAPGTWASLVTVAILGAIYFLGGGRWSVSAWQVVLVGGLLLSSALSVALGPWAIEFFGRTDPGSFVLDEAAGICVSLLLLPQFAGWGEVGALALGFAAFRLFDITKPPPIHRLEKLPAGWGILADDLLAGVYANLVCQMILRLW